MQSKDNQINKPASHIRAVLLDWDGTIVDSARAMFLSYRHAYREHLDIEFPKDDADFRTIVPMRLAESSAKFGGEQAANIAVSYNRFYETEAYKTGRVFQGIRETLSELTRRGYLLGVASNKSLGRILADIDYLGLEDLVDVYVTSEDTTQRKPDPAPLLKAAEKLDIPPEDCAYVGDYSGDIVAAHAANMLSVAVLWGGIFSAESLLAEHPDYVIERPEQMLDIFQRAAIPEEAVPLGE